MREYIRKSAGVPKDVYIQVKGALMGYPRLKAQRLDILQSMGGRSQVMPPSGMGSPTENKVIQLEAITRQLEAIDQSCVEIRGERSGKTTPEFDPIQAYWSYAYFNLQHLRQGEQDEGPSTRTWHRFKDSLTEKIAKRLQLF